MDKIVRSVYIRSDVYKKAKEVYGERGVSAAIERLLTTHLFQFKLRCSYCGAIFSNRLWDKMPSLKGHCPECNSEGDKWLKVIEPEVGGVK